MGACKWGWAFAVAALFAMLWMALGSRATPPDPPAAPAIHATRGAGSCAAQACHGGVAPAPPLPGQTALRNEYTTWITRDKHADAFRVLSDDRSKSIARNLASRSGGKETPAHRDKRCLACHVGPGASATASATFLQDGVGCESCHGPAGDWIDEHTRYDWKNRPDESKRSVGMAPVLGLADRATACAGCHVGAPPDPSRGLLLRDVNHDLIAAGHPRLNFEFGAYLANLPKHWVERGRPTDFEARAWAIGQAATLKASLELLRWRAGASSAPEAPAPWPELSEYGCFSCHFSLRATPRRRDPDQPLGRPTWASWQVPIARELAKELGGGRGIEGTLTPLRRAMSAPNPDARQVGDLAKRATRDLDGWMGRLERATLQPAQLGRLVTAFRLADDPLATDGVYSWDHATQRYLALVALYQSLTEQGAPDPKLKADLEALVKRLEFPEGYDSPREQP